MQATSGDTGAEDLIDLGYDSPVSRVRVTGFSSVNSSTANMSEEQEHLLDVCPPKLEEKLSLVLADDEREKIQDLTKMSDQSPGAGVLVTLGHEQIVPVRKRIDVVSLDTMKRIRVITENLEPVVRRGVRYKSIGDQSSADVVDVVDVVDGGRQDPQMEARGAEEESGKMTEKPSIQQIEDAFEFLGQLDDNDCPAQIMRASFRGNVRSVPEDIGQKMDKKMSRWRSSRNRSFCRRPTRKSFSEGSSLRRTFSAARSCVSAGSNDPQTSLESLAPSGSINSPEESWSDSDRSEYSEVDWSWLEEVECPRCGTGGATTIDFRDEGKSGEALFASTIASSSGAMDSRWPGSTTGINAENLSETEADRTCECECERECERGCERECESQCERKRLEDRHSSCALASGSGSCREIEETSDSPTVSMVAGATDKSALSVEAEHRHRPNEILRERIERPNDTRPATSSWLRASMRRLRQFRLPETACTDASAGHFACGRTDQHILLSACNTDATVDSNAGAAATATATTAAAATVAANSLPDIALIAPEILAAQTNDTSGGLLRPSSAPARNANYSSTNRVNSPSRGARPAAGRHASRHAARQTSTNASRSASRSASRHASRLLVSRRNPSTTIASCRRENALPLAVGSPTASVSMDTSVMSTNISGTICSSPTRGTVGQTATASPRRPNSTRNIGRTGGEQDAEEEEDDEEDSSPLGKWPHALSPALACLGCTLGLFNISRFAILSVQFGANFIVQFLLLSLIIGIPLLTLQVCLGQRLAAGSVDMWRISPLFQGVGVALLVAQAFIGIYSIIGVSWMFVYFRDSFVTKQDKYRWAEPFVLYREDSKLVENVSAQYKLHETVPDYFSGVVLQRHRLNEPDGGGAGVGSVTLKFQLAFNLAVVWMIVFVSLSKGLRSYGKVVYVFTLIPVFGTLVLCTKLLGLTPLGSIHQLFPATVWREFFINGKSWVAASSEVFLTWGLLGAAAMQIAAHNKHKHLLQRDTSLVIVLTFVVLLLAAFLANTCVQILRHHEYVYTASSFERMSGYTFMRLVNEPAPAGYSGTPERFLTHASFIVGQRITQPGADSAAQSGYQVLRLSTELVPATLAILGTDQVSPFWAVLFYFILILFGIAQQLAIWHCVITGIMAINAKTMKLWETTVTFFSCACAYILGLPMATELGIYVVYYLDYTVGGAWWIMVLYLVEIGAVFAVRGRPHTGDAVVAELFPPTGRCLRHWAGPLLSFTWNVILPVTLMVLSIAIFKGSGFRELYNYRRAGRGDYWSVWARQVGATIQLTPILIIPAVAIIQTCRYLNNGPPDIFDRIQMLYRPSLEPEEDPRDGQSRYYGQSVSTGVSNIHGNGISPHAPTSTATTTATSTDVPFEDPPPKYTPPPSYTTATGARIAKMLRQSLRRSVRRITSVLGEGSATFTRQRTPLQPPPPDYATVLVEMNNEISLSPTAMLATRDATSLSIADYGNCSSGDIASINADDTRQGHATANVLLPHSRADRHRPNTIDRTSRIATSGKRFQSVGRTHSTIEREHGNRQRSRSNMSSFTAADVANILRSSIRRGTLRTRETLTRSFGAQSQRNSCAQIDQPESGAQLPPDEQSQTPVAMASVENLIEAAAPIGQQDSLVSRRSNDDDGSLLSYESSASGNDNDNGNGTRSNAEKTREETMNSVSVI